MDEPGREASVTWRDSWSTTPRCPSCWFDARPDHQAGSPGPRARRGRLEGGRGPNAVPRGTRPARRVRRLHRPAQRKTVRTPRGRGPHPIPWPWCSTRRSGITPVLIDNAPVILVGKHYVSVISPGPLRHRPGGDRAPLVHVPEGGSVRIIGFGVGFYVTNPRREDTVQVSRQRRVRESRLEAPHAADEASRPRRHAAHGRQ
jgi:hypothetical protein